MSQVLFFIIYFEYNYIHCDTASRFFLATNKNYGKLAKKYLIWFLASNVLCFDERDSNLNLFIFRA